jgi:mannose-6-phosphate isomerase class I
LSRASTDADRALHGERRFVEGLARRLLKPQPDNLVARPWGGTQLRAFKHLGPDPTGRTIGESFEIAAADDDAEARRHPSVLALADGSTVTLPALLAAHAEVLLGDAFVARYGRRLPLLPKLLDVAELLSVQAHPPGNTEVYVIVAAEPGATLRLGFAEDVVAAELAESFAEGRREQQRLLELCAPAFSADALQEILKPWLARRGAAPVELETALRPVLDDVSVWPQVAQCLAKLHTVFWRTLDRLNAIPVKAGDVIYNANPPRVVAASGKPASAEVHALGNPEGCAVLALEIRRPGITFRAWDNVRFPLREIDIDAALEAMSLKATAAEDFVVAPRVVRPGVRRSVDCEYLRLEHLEPTRSLAIDVPAAGPHTLHTLAGSIAVRNERGEAIGELARGESALVPVQVGAYRIVATEEPALVVKVELPPYGP